MSKRIHSLILDTSAIVKDNTSLLDQAEAIFTTPAVIAELRDKATRERVETTLLPFITQRLPSPESVKIVQEFARRTGDLGVLSRTDIELLALTREIECERLGGDWRLKNAPGQRRINGPPPKTPGESQNNGEGETEEDDESKCVRAMSDEPPNLSNLSISETEQTGDDIEIASPEDSEPESNNDSEGWITPSNIGRKQQRASQSSPNGGNQTAPTMQAALATTDFAMQNVALQMGLNLFSPSTLQQITHVKTTLLRCHGCFAQTRDTSRQFCPRCGHPTLTRVTCSTGADGAVRLHLKRNMQWNTRGARYSIPKPAQGSANGKVRDGGGGKNGWGTRLILAEDQKEYVRAVEAGKREREMDLLDLDTLPAILSGERGHGRESRPRVGAGKNVNSTRKRR